MKKALGVFHMTRKKLKNKQMKQAMAIILTHRAMIFCIESSM